MKPTRARVLRGGIFAGTIERTREGATFTYAATFLDRPRPAWEGGLAYHLPYTRPRTEIRGVNVHSFFAGLLPEGIRLTALVRRVKTSADDLLSLLVEAGADCIGDVSVVADDGRDRSVTPAVDVARLDTIRFADVLAASLAGARGAEPTLSGVQEKLSAAMISLPLRGKAGSGAYLLKLEPPRLRRLVHNEHFFMQAARESGLDVARTELVHDAEGVPGLLVERFDRARVARETHAIHQEDACQFLERYPGDKYVVSHGDIAEGIGALSAAPIVELAKYLRLIAFSYLVGNGDLHAKNVSLRTRLGTGLVELTPAYDLLSTLPYGDRTMALSFEGRDDHWKRTHFVAFGARHGVRDGAVRSMLDELCDVAPRWIERLDEIGLERKKRTDLARVITKRRADLGRK